VYYTVPGEIPPGGQTTFTYRADPPLAARSDRALQRVGRGGRLRRGERGRLRRASSAGEVPFGVIGDSEGDDLESFFTRTFARIADGIDDFRRRFERLF